MGVTIGKLHQVEIRELWKNEARDFTRWLADNLESLSDAIGTDLELIEIEKKVDESRFTLDILAEDDEGLPVIIENQLEKTDHGHLGQIITYATNLDARTVIWITKEPRQEHINAVNWLNEFTDKKFFLVQLEAYKIDDSYPAPIFSLICKPSNEAKTLGKSKKKYEDEKQFRKARRQCSDTIIVPARKAGFERVFIGEQRWYSIRIRDSMIRQLKYIVSYQVDPEFAITHFAEIKEIVPSHENPDKYMVIFKGPAQKIKSVPLGVKSRIQGPVYCQFSKLNSSKNIDDLLSGFVGSDADEAA